MLSGNDIIVVSFTDCAINLVRCFICSALRTAQYSIKGIYMQLAGVVGGNVVPVAFVPPSNVDINEFLAKVVIPELAQLVRGFDIVYKGFHK